MLLLKETVRAADIFDIYQPVDSDDELLKTKEAKVTYMFKHVLRQIDGIYIYSCVGK